MRPLSSEEQLEREAIIAEYYRLTFVAAEALSIENMRARLNWHRFYEAHEKIHALVERLKHIHKAP
jgi:hypothetical protein